jgi:hypothetical protein
MNAVGAIYLSVASILMLTLPRRLAMLPLLLSATYMTRGQIIEIGPANFTIPQLLVTFGFLRAMARGERVADGMHTVDKLLLLWATILIGSSAFHTSEAWLYRSGIVWTELGCYFLFRIFLQGLEDVRSTFRFMCVAMLPLAALMLFEKATGTNPFGSLGGVNAYSLVRDGHIRAGGPYAHPILAGTVGAMAIAMGLAVWKTSRWRALAGWLSGAGVVAAATSSGPILMVAFIVVALFAWRFRHHMRAVRWTILAGLLVLNAVMKDPIYFLMARVDISGGSQGYYRSQLIRSSIEHLQEWWLVGTDYTRHWMSSGVYANSRHADITNHILAQGVLAGLPLMIVFLAIVSYSFRDVGRAVKQCAPDSVENQAFVWTLGAALFGFFMNFWSISLFDQSIIFFYLCLASIQSVVRQESPVPAVRRGRATTPMTGRRVSPMTGSGTSSRSFP